MKKDFRRVVVVKGDYKGRVGKADFSNVHKTGNVMFYPVEGEYPYRVCLNKEDVQESGQSSFLILIKKNDIIFI